jgi:pyruvate/2-oxoglutarate dehydrogenase complex dihydrolipoamide dehydrogenase (E3) component
LIEREHLGGTCVNDGCTPTKTLVASARAAWAVRHAAEFGVSVQGPITVDMRAVKARMNEVVVVKNPMSSITSMINAASSETV